MWKSLTLYPGCDRRNGLKIGCQETNLRFCDLLFKSGLIVQAVPKSCAGEVVFGARNRHRLGAYFDTPA